MTPDDATASSVPGGPLFLRTREEWRAWLDAHAATAPEVLVGVWKKGTGGASISWPELVEEALCVGWIDGVRRGLGDDAYSIRFTPRRHGSHWSRVNVDLVTRLEAEGRMTEAGRAAFAARREDRTATASYERTVPAVLDADQEAAFRAEPVAWQWFCAAPASYRRVATHWVVSAKRPQTRARRLAALVASSREGRRLRQFDPKA